MHKWFPPIIQPLSNQTRVMDQYKVILYHHKRDISQKDIYED